MIISQHNEQFKMWMKLKQKKYRDTSGLFLVYGPHLVEEAKRANCVKEIITTDESIEGTIISKALMEKLKTTETAYNICAVCYKKTLKIKSDKVLILEDVQDPDNVGALLRSALAFGFKHIILSENSADLYNDKTIRASKGAIFHLMVERMNVYDATLKLKQEGYSIYATDIEGKTYYSKKKKSVIVLGNEGKGITDRMLALADERIKINTQTVESLNVSVAGAIFMYEWSR